MGINEGTTMKVIRIVARQDEIPYTLATSSSRSSSPHLFSCNRARYILFNLGIGELVEGEGVLLIFNDLGRVVRR